ncbi:MULTISPECIES: YchE family NAAT transporter [unclassified Shewanella]|uniref:YchE family NAAT transporter n=1 Tax=unclassified Shewanella TaxID=196818 RepID=UPI000C81AB04|nr:MULTISPECIES: YchE family NAAT transporter [unclassified Shewanella]MDO6620711.1 YchE family NAAT transporter [Shewanella sp. 6_MG-2023]MDO6678871.1 YchE family NAAT transporter [Shewanella sp. 4_MG-2023]MDO6777277.1 YchE family NAAT transporter [Shewanella sp. 3_MG-2023]PMG28578.1 amino acid transporter [Shewanella sp. 10N.286.52.C2]PMG41835.1 amino acid transporter [Shewanella sp. 10N.286.52.B9]
MDLMLYVKFFLGLIAIINPVGLLPVFVTLTSHQTEVERNHTGKVANFAVVIILLTTIFIGEHILNMFSISLSAFRIAGGSLIAIIAMSMLQGKLSQVKRNQEEDREASGMESVAVVPLALPLMAGPGAISSVIVFSSTNNSLVDMIGMSITVIIFGLMSFGLFRMAPIIFKLLGTTGINVITRLMGLLMLSIGIEVIAAGIKGLFPTLMS